MKFGIYNEDGTKKPELKIGLALDDYKLKNKEDWWNRCLKRLPDVVKFYYLEREEVACGLSPNITMCFRFYKLKELK